MIVLGIDPGASGGLAIVSHAEGFPARVIHAEKMPETPADVLEAVWKAAHVFDAGFAILEKVWAAPTQGRKLGASGMFKFGQGYGHLEMALLAIRIPHHKITPQVWQKKLGCLTGGDKNVSKAKAQELFPDSKVTLAVADAMLLAYFWQFSRYPTPTN